MLPHNLCSPLRDVAPSWLFHSLAGQCHHIQLRCKTRQLPHPIGQRGEGHHHKVRPRSAAVAQGCQVGDCLHASRGRAGAGWCVEISGQAW